jgi:site-specific recombinase XerD
MLVRGKGNRERWLPISDETLAALHEYIAEAPGSAGPLLRSVTHPGRGITSSYVGVLISKGMLASGIKSHGYDGKSAHALRHTMAGAMIDDGADVRDVQAALGHSNRSTVHVYLRRRVAAGRLREVMGQRSYR